MSSNKKKEVLATSSAPPAQNIGTVDVKQTATETGSAVKNFFTRAKDFIQNKPLVVLFGLVATVVVGLLVAWIIYTIIQKKLLEKKSSLLEETKMPLSGLSLHKCDGSKIPETANGKRFGFSFWIYIHNLDKNAGIMRHVLHRGDEKNAMGGSPTVFMDPNLNKLYIMFDTTSKNPGDPEDLSTQSADIQFQYMVAKRGIVVDYVPLQRWVHIGIVVNEDTNGGSIASYVDGELVKTTTSNKTSVVGPYTVAPKINNLALDRRANVFIGGNTDTGSGIGFSGLVSMVEFYNYNLNAKDMYEVYARGPIHVTMIGKLANSLGIGTITNQYGLRNPIYKKTSIIT